MTDNLRQLLNVCYEIEGLITLIDERGENVPNDLYSLVSSKARKLSLGIDNLCDNVSLCESLPQEDVQCEPVEEVRDYDCDKEDEDVVFMDDTVSEFPDDADCESRQEEYDVVDEEDAIVPEPEMEDDDVEEYPVQCDEDVVDEDEPLNVERMIACQASRDLRKAFTINDKFRFKRELFGNSDTEMTDTLNLVSAMSSMAEAEEYFYHDMEWDSENEEVKDFMSIIANHFKSQEIRI